MSLTPWIAATVRARYEKQLWELLRQDRWKDAIELGEQAVSPTAEGEGLLALAYLRGGLPAQAQASAQWASQRDLVAYWPKVALGTLACRWGGDQQAGLAALRQAVVAYPYIPEGWLALLSMTSDPSEARRAKNTLLRLAPQGYPFRTKDSLLWSDTLPSSLYLAAFPEGRAFIPQNPPSEPLVLPLKRDRRGMLSVEVELEGHPFRLLYDTGGGRHLVLTPPALARLKPRFITRTVLTGVQGQGSARLYRAERLRFGSLELSPLVVESTSADLGGFDGLIGWRVLGELVQRLEPDRGTLTLSKKPQPVASGTVCLPLHLMQDQPVIGVECRPDSKRAPLSVWALLDTGSTDDYFSLRVGALLAPKGRRRIPQANITGIGQSRQQIVQERLSVAFDLFSERGELLTSYAEATSASFLDTVLSPALGFEHGLLLGMDFLGRFSCIELDPLQQQARLVPR